MDLFCITIVGSTLAKCVTNLKSKEINKMDLAKFAAMPPEAGGGTFLKFTPADSVKIVRFMYTAVSGVDEDLGIKCRRKYFDKSTKKVVWDTPEGKWTMALKVAVYTSKTEYTFMTWDRSAVFGRDNLMPLFEAAGGRICDTVYKVTCSKAGTLDATFSFFPVRDSAAFAMPSLIEEGGFDGGAEVDEDVTPPAAVAKAASTAPKASVPKAAVAPAASAPAQKAPTKRKQFWEEDA